MKINQSEIVHIGQKKMFVSSYISKKIKAGWSLLDFSFLKFYLLLSLILTRNTSK